MTSVTIHRKNHRIVGFIIEGHSGFANAGSDIVCASISILAYTAINALNIVANIAEEDINFHIDDDLGYLSLDTKKSINDKSDVIYNSFLVGIQLLIEDYSDYITLKYEEV